MVLGPIGCQQLIGCVKWNENIRARECYLYQFVNLWRWTQEHNDIVSTHAPARSQACHAFGDFGVSTCLRVR